MTLKSLNATWLGQWLKMRQRLKWTTRRGALPVWMPPIVLALLSVSCSYVGALSAVSTAEPTLEPTAISTAAATVAPAATPTEVTGELFDGQSAFVYLAEQMDFGPRWPGSEGHAAVGDYIVKQLTELGWSVEEQRFPYQSIEGRNIIGRANVGKGEVIVLGAHYDTRKVADQTPGSLDPVPGAVDGASGVAVLLELARTLDLEQIENEIWLSFFDVEDNGSGAMPGFAWIVGSTYMVQNLAATPEAMVLVDMVGDADQQFYYEGNSDFELQARLWVIASDLGFADYFIPELKYTMIDDHLPFAQAGIPAVDIIDFDYPYWHTVEDTLDKASPESLMRVGRTLEVWLEDRLDE